MFHLEQGLCFERLAGGGVRITKYHEPFTMDGTERGDWDIEMDACRWPSVVAAVTPAGDNADTHAAAEKSHRGKA